MPNFRYQAIDENGDKVRGSVSAAEMAAAVEQLRSRGQMVTEIEPAGGDNAAGGFSGLDFLKSVGQKEIVLFFRMFAALIASNVTISAAMDILYYQAENRKFKRILGDVREKIEGGLPLSSAMAEHPRIFPKVVTNMIKAGELGGILDMVVIRITDFLESKAALRSKMIITMIYPSLVVVVATVVVIFLVTFVIPKFSALLGGQTLPANTQFLLDAADFLTHNVRSIIVGIIAAILAFILFFAVPGIRFYTDRYKIYIPVLGPIFRYGVIVQFSKTLASLLEAGITLVDALQATAQTITNEALRLRIKLMNEKVMAGEPLSDAIESDPLFTPIVKAMVRIGEHSGLMDQAMNTVGELHEKILQNKIAKMSAMIEPVLIVGLGGIVGYVAWGLIAGMLSLYNSAR